MDLFGKSLLVGYRIESLKTDHFCWQLDRKENCFPLFCGHRNVILIDALFLFWEEKKLQSLVLDREKESNFKTLFYWTKKFCPVIYCLNFLKIINLNNKFCP